MDQVELEIPVLFNGQVLKHRALGIPATVRRVPAADAPVAIRARFDRLFGLGPATLDFRAFDGLLWHKAQASWLQIQLSLKAVTAFDVAGAEDFRITRHPISGLPHYRLGDGRNSVERGTQADRSGRSFLANAASARSNAEHALFIGDELWMMSPGPYILNIPGKWAEDQTTCRLAHPEITPFHMTNAVGSYGVLDFDRACADAATAYGRCQAVPPVDIEIFDASPAPDFGAIATLASAWYARFGCRKATLQESDRRLVNLLVSLRSAIADLVPGYAETVNPISPGDNWPDLDALYRIRDASAVADASIDLLDFVNPGSLSKPFLAMCKTATRRSLARDATLSRADAEAIEALDLPAL